MRGAWTTKTKAYFSVAALEMLADDFVAEEMIHSIIELCELATTHPDFGTEGNPGANEYAWADQATDALITFFLEEFAVDDDGEGCPRFEFNPKKGMLEIVRYRAKWRPRRKRVSPPPGAAFERVPLDLLRHPNSKN